MAIAQFVKQPRTDADLRALLDAFPDLLPDGRIIAHESVEQIIGVRRDEPRYRTVTKHWRRAVFQEQRIYIDGRSAEGAGFKALTPDEMVRYANREVRLVGRRLKRALLVAATPSDTEIHDPNVRVYRARLLSAAEQIASAHGRVMRELGTALGPARQLPRQRPA